MRTKFSTEGTKRSSRWWLLLVALALTACGTEGVPLGADAPSTSPSTVGVSVTTAAAVAPFSVVWSQVIDETPFVEGGYQEMFGVTAGGPGLVAVGLDWSGAGEAVWTSPDGLAWTRVDYDEPAFFGWMFSVTAGGPGLVAVGIDRSSDNIDAAVWTSPDGFTWSRVDDETVLGGEGDQTMWSVTTGGPGLVAVGSDETVDVAFGITAGANSDAAVWTSPDGLTWTRVYDEQAFGGENSQQMTDVTAGGPGLVAVGVDKLVIETESSIHTDYMHAAVWTSPDGFTWTRVQDDAALIGDGYQQMISVTAGGPGLVAVGFAGSGAAVWTSPDGFTWTQQHDAVPGDSGGGQMMSVTAGGPGLVAVGMEGSGSDEDGAIWTSPDGINWTQVRDEAVVGVRGRQWINSVTAGGPGLIAVGIDEPNGDGGGSALGIWAGAKED